MLFSLFLAAASVVAGGIAAVAGFGIGSVLTPVLALHAGTRVAVAAIAIPHFVATVQRYWILRRHVDRRVLLGFGIASAAGGLAGALLHARFSSRALAIVFGVLLTLAAISELTGWMQRIRWGRSAAWIAGAVSGVLGGLVGNQGSVRTAALLGFQVPKHAFVATATAIGLFVDAARLPVYLVTSAKEIAAVWPFISIATAGVVVGTAFGARLLGRIPEGSFRRIVAVLLLGLALYMIVAGGT